MERLTLALLGGLLALDGTAVGQFMVSRPLVAGALGGWVLGDPVRGLLVGFVLELFHLSLFQVGGARLPETGPAALSGAAVAGFVPGAAGLALGVAFGLVVGDLGGRSVDWLRHLNARLTPDPGLGSVNAGELERAHIGSILIDFMRGLVLTLIAVLVGPGLAGMLTSGWPLTEGATLGLLLVAGAAPLGILWRSLSESMPGRMKTLALGVGLGLVLALVRAWGG